MKKDRLWFALLDAIFGIEAPNAVSVVDHRLSLS
jgi:hypothetical protein